MRGITLGVFSAQPIYDVDFQTNVLDVAQTMGYAIPSLERRLLLNRLMKAKKNIGFYQLHDTLANFALGISGYEQFRMIDWKKTANIYSPYGGLIYKPDGLEGNGVDAYVNTNFNPATMGVNYTLNSASRGAIVYKEPTGSATSTVLDGVNSGTRNLMFQLTLNIQQRINALNSLSDGVSLTGTGLKVITRINANDVQIIVKNILNSRVQSSDSVYSGNQIIIGGYPNTYSNTGVSLYFMGSYIPYGVSQNFRTIYNQFLSDSGLSPIA